MRRSFVLAAVVAGGLLYALTGAAMLFVPQWFFDNIGTFPPFNRHYTGDLGAFNLPLGIALLLAARHPKNHRGLIGFAAAASLIHALNHFYDDLAGRSVVMPSQTLQLLIFAIVLVVAYFASADTAS